MANYSGIDVSVFQGNINWGKVKTDGRVQFAILRGGYGRYEKDEKFERNYKECKANKIPVGVYHYSYADTVARAKQEADFVISYLKGKSIDLFVAYDIEDKTLINLSKNQLTDIAQAFLDKLTVAGYRVCLYASKSWLENKFNPLPYDKWVAQWNNVCTYTGNKIAWQYSEAGTIDGISGRVDLDYYYGEIKKKSVYEIAVEVRKGLWGDKTTKPTRKQRLEAAGYNYDEVQRIVTQLENQEKAKNNTDKYKKGSSIKLSNTTVYVSSTAKSGVKKSGTYYIYDGKKVNGRYRITSNKNFVGKTPIANYVTGWIAGN